jgi:sugar-phosphatase
MRVQPQREEPREKGMHGMLSIEIIVVPQIPHDFPRGLLITDTEPDFLELGRQGLVGRPDNDLGNVQFPAEWRPSLIEVNCDAILFDMDNTLLDSTICNEGIMGRWAEKHGLDRDLVIHISHGRRTTDSIREAAPHLDAQEEAKEIDAEELVTREGIAEVPGARRLLAGLKPHQWAIVTSASRALANLRMECAGLPIPEVLIAGDDVSNGKPDPEGFLKAASRLGVPPGRCVVVEDSLAGILAGQRAGMKVVGVTTTFAAEKLLGVQTIANFHDVTFHLER